MSRKFLDFGGTAGRSRRHSRSRSVEEVHVPAFTVFGKGLFELEDFDMDDPHSSQPKNSQTQALEVEAWPDRLPDMQDESKRSKQEDECHCVDSVALHQSWFKTDYVYCQEKDTKDNNSTDVELVIERFGKLLLGEDMSGGKKGVSSAMALSNAITNLSASTFGELWRLEPLSAERKAKWRKEIGWFLSVVDYIVEFVPSYQSSADGSMIEVMVTKPRSDIQMNIPALRKLEAMLLECMDSFVDTEFCYVERGMAESDTNVYNRNNSNPRQKEKWWLPAPRVPEGGLTGDTKKKLQHQRDSVNQILKAAMAINSQVLSEMEIPDIYWESFAKNGKAILGDVIYRHITSEHFCPDVLLCSIDLSTDHSILEVKNRIEAALALWRKKILIKDSKRSSKTSWGAFYNDEKRELYAERAEIILILLKLKFPGLPQTVLDMSKIQYNKDVGQSILESYSRVLESLAFNILSRIDDVLHADEMARQHKPCLSRSTSTDSAITSPLFEDDHYSTSNINSFAPSPMPLANCVYPTPSSGSPIHTHMQSRPIHTHMQSIPKSKSGPLIKLDDQQTGPHTTTPSPSPSLKLRYSSSDTSHDSIKTLSDFMGWQGNAPPPVDRAPPPPDPPLMMMKKKHNTPAPIMMVNNGNSHDYNTSRRYYWSYIESLEKRGGVYSPPSRD